MADILVIDDDPAVIRLVSLILTAEGHRVRPADSGTKGLDLLKDQTPELIVLDLQMPVMDGRAFYREARSSGYAGPVLILSAFGASQARQELGAQASLSKPFEPDELVSAVSTLASE